MAKLREEDDRVNQNKKNVQNTIKQMSRTHIAAVKVQRMYKRKMAAREAALQGTHARTHAHTHVHTHATTFVSNQTQPRQMLCCSLSLPADMWTVWVVQSASGRTSRWAV